MKEEKYAVGYMEKVERERIVFLFDMLAFFLFVDKIFWIEVCDIYYLIEKVAIC